MGDTSFGQLAFVPETTTGVIPANPAFRALDFTSEDLVLNQTKTRSAAVTSQRVVRGKRTTGRDVGGGPTFELYRAAEVDILLQALMGNGFDANGAAPAGGTASQSFTWERQLSPTDFRRFVGWRPSQMEFTIAPEAIISVKASGVGYSMLTDNAKITGSTYVAPGNNPKLTSLDVVGVSISNGLTGLFDFDQISFTISNQLAASKRIGPSSVRRIKEGQCLVTGQLRMFVDDKTIADAFVAGTAFTMGIPMVFGNVGYLAQFFGVSVDDYNDPNTGNNNDFMATISFECTLDPASNTSFAFVRYGGAL